MAFEPTSRLDGKVAVITGGLGAIGYATAARLAARGASCVLIHRPTHDEVERIASLTKGIGQRHTAIRADIVDSASLRAASDEVKDAYARCDILVNSAGYTRSVPAHDLEALSDDLIDDVLRINFRAVIATIRAFLPLLAATGEGLVVNVSSIAAFTGVGSNLAYIAAKAGLDAAGDALARVLAPEVRVVSVSPGVIDSSFVPGRGADFVAKAAASTPLGRIGTPDDVAAAIEALATTMSFVTGTRIVVDGGRHLGGKRP